jgi:hypothetical protein
MITELANILPDFSEVNHTRCFLHIINLCAKSIIKQFDIQKKQDNEPLSKAECELQDLARDIEFEEQQAIETMAQHGIDSETNIETEGDYDIEGWIDEMALLSLDKQAGLMESIHPLKMVLVKVSLRYT